MKNYTEVQVTINELYTAFMGAVNLILTCGATATHWLLVLPEEIALKVALLPAQNSHCK